MAVISKLEFLEVGFNNRSLRVNDFVYQAGIGPTDLKDDINALKVMVFEEGMYNQEQLTLIYLFLDGIK